MTGDKINVMQLRSSRGVGGGPEKTILFTAKHLDTDRFTMPVVYLKSADDPEFDMDTRASKLGLPFFVALDEKYKLDLGALRRLLSLLKEHQIHVIHSHGYKSDTYAFLLSRIYKVGLVSTAHGPYPIGRFVPSAGNWKVWYLYDRFTMKLLRYFDRVLMVSETLAPVLRHSKIPESKLEVVRNGIDADLFRRQQPNLELKRQLGFPEGGLLLGSVGRLNPQKDYDALFAAMRILLERGQDVYLGIAGSGPLEEKIREDIASLDLGERVRLLGHLSDVRGFYSILDLYVLATHREGLPNTVLEAMALEVPIVASRVDGVEEAVRHDEDALLCPPREPAALADAIHKVLGDEELRTRLVQSARERVETDFSFARRVRTLERIYTEVGLERAQRSDSQPR